MESEVVMRDVTRAAAHFVDLSQGSAHNFHSRPNAIAVASITDCVNKYGIIDISPIIAQKQWRTIDIVYDQINIAVIIEISESYSATHPFFHERFAVLRGYFGKRAVAIVFVK